MALRSVASNWGLLIFTSGMRLPAVLDGERFAQVLAVRAKK
jgi:hypothetical protein